MKKHSILLVAALMAVSSSQVFAGYFAFHADATGNTDSSFSDNGPKERGYTGSQMSGFSDNGNPSEKNGGEVCFSDNGPEQRGCVGWGL